MSNIDREAVIKDIKENAKDLTDVLIILENFPPADDWILLSEKPPETDGRYYVTRYDAVTRSVFVDILFYKHDSWWIDAIRVGDHEVIAWQPLPGPYKGER